MSDSLTLIRTGAQNECYRFELEYKDEFITWHSTTQWYQQQDARLKKKTVTWGSKKNALGWQHFEEAALRNTGEPKVVCVRCQKTLKHPTIHGTSGMDGHLESRGCQSGARSRGLVQLSISEGFRAGVLP